MTCPRCNLSCCICELVTDHMGLGGAVFIAICAAVFIGAFAYALWPGGAP